MILPCYSVFMASRQQHADEEGGRKAALFCRPLGRHLARGGVGARRLRHIAPKYGRNGHAEVGP